MGNFKICIAESCTAGTVTSLISKFPGISKWFVGSVCTYNIDMKEKILKVPREIAEPCDCVSEEVALIMAKNARILFGSATISISTTGYINDASYCYICVSSIFGTIISKYVVSDNSKERHEIQLDIAKEAIRIMKTHYMKYREEFNAIFDREVVSHFESIIKQF